MGFLSLDVTRTGVVLREINERGTRILERFNTHDVGMRRALITAQRELARDASLTEVRASVQEPELGQRLKHCVRTEASSGGKLEALADSL
ncbi:hypothetical protein GQF56_16155 [Rhodobacter sphaeroides]|jgi:hypothetical protein|uniref:Uncharacterized protein n=1 Tax=Cereibacter sphaeroides (strain ATCC 17023 / DSM 158 / JCM 6121 / CCUG 31486 / LMG 2827 / NBRC 12203 / NCIMB 8253 / ATH 2.4.1.) TaxID=272943 RepID=U5NMI5_CERS4|nr:hypothetical protein [Cereibacter sphaeroides]AGY32472.1 hypothetical protein RSP_7616 [Cereibacter sphaeroides 2.4.1]AMJ49535.1 hypothetical protein APX01_18460 [Cereibacter sphaeroides]ANS36248.1 hypothetical protein A3858_18465 [Cereibacter sphaeroides]ATN65304.1 hypothetical protein A3857_18485 [Cereibacter sphaeroides]AXC63522.1 hypothetical protein DQL45_19265 [Cereibacter sphaeroides 2.4.1]